MLNKKFLLGPSNSQQSFSDASSDSQNNMSKENNEKESLSKRQDSGLRLMADMHVYLTSILNEHWRKTIVQFANQSEGRIRLLSEAECASREARVAFPAQRYTPHKSIGVFQLQCRCAPNQSLHFGRPCPCHERLAKQCEQIIADYRSKLDDWLCDPWVICVIPVPRLLCLRKRRTRKPFLLAHMDTLVMTLQPRPSSSSSNGETSEDSDDGEEREFKRRRGMEE